MNTTKVKLETHALSKNLHIQILLLMVNGNNPDCERCDKYATHAELSRYN